MRPARIAALLGPFLERPLSPAQLDQISTYIDLLLRWNARINLTSIRDPEQIVPRHFGESLFLARHVFPDASRESEPDHSKLGAQSSKLTRVLVRVLDLGSGAGFPALPIKIWTPQIHLTMIESNHKKAAFLREAVRALRLTDVDVIPERAESVATRLPSMTSTAEPAKGNRFQPAEVVTFRAVERFDQILPLATKFLAANARLAVLVTAAQLEQLQTLPAITWAIIHVPESHSGLLALGQTDRS